jgi:hypothetical protein
MVRLVVVLGAIVLAISTAVAQSRLDPDYVQGYGSWQAEDYPNASTRLSRYRLGASYGQTYDVDYWLGTSWCRMPGEERLGVDLLEWGHAFGPMPDAVREQYRVERDACRQFLAAATATRVKPRVIATNLQAPSTGRASGKLYYVAGGDKGGLSAYPLRIKRPLPPEQYDRRLFPLSDPAKAVAGVRALAPGFRVETQGRFVLASGAKHTAEQLQMIARRLDHYVGFLIAEYGLRLPDTFITVYLVPDIGALRLLADRVHGLDASPVTLGYAFQNDLSVVGVLNGTAAGTLLHELFHLTVRSTYGAIPQWLDEGIASLYETATVAGDRYYGEPNWRSRVVSELRFQFPRIGVPDVVLTPWFGDEAPGENPRPGERSSEEQAYVLALSRYFVMYLQERGRLKAVFEAYRDRRPPAEYVPAQVQAVRILETVVGRSAGDIDRDFRAWLPTVADPNRRLHTGKIEPKEIPRELPPSIEREPAPGSSQ